MIELELWLYGKPSWDMDIEGNEDIQPEMLRKRADDLYRQLHAAAEVLETLQKNGWRSRGSIYSVNLYKPSISTKKDVLLELETLQVTTEHISILERGEVDD